MACISDSRHVPGVLHEYVLEAASGGDEGNITLASISNCAEGAVKAPVRTARRNPQAVDFSQPFRSMRKLVRRDPRRRDAEWNVAQSFI